MSGRKDANRRRAPLPRAKKQFGQHFLEPAWVARLLEAIRPAPTDRFLEIGTGRGALTLPLAARVARLVGIEIDRDLARDLAPRLPPHAGIVQADVLDVDLRRLLQGVILPVRVVGNLPYNIASPILFRLLGAADEGKVFTDASLMLQAEVVDRITAVPG